MKHILGSLFVILAIPIVHDPLTTARLCVVEHLTRQVVGHVERPFLALLAED